MNDHLNPAARRRGIVALRNDGAPSMAEVRASIEAVNRAFAEFRDANDRRLREIEARGSADAVTEELTNRINAAVTPLQGTVDDLATRLAAMNLNGSPGAGTPEQRAYAAQFERFFRRGEGAENLHEMAVRAAMTRQSDPDGGYLAPHEMETAIDRVLGAVSAMRGLAQIRTISAASYKKLVNKGGATSGWVGETGSRDETNTPTLSELDFTAMELYANPKATQTVLDDARIDIAAWLAEEVSIEFAEEEGAAFISGNGVNKPRGLLGYTNVANASYEWGKIGYVAGGHATLLNDADKLIAQVYAIKQGYRTNGAWLSNRGTMEVIRKLKDGQGQYLWQPSVQAGQPATLFGYPTHDDDNMPDIGANAYPLAFGDFKRAYLIVDRMGVRVLRDPFSAKPYVSFYTTKRVGGGVQNFEAVKLLKIAGS